MRPCCWRPAPADLRSRGDTTRLPLAAAPQTALARDEAGRTPPLDAALPGCPWRAAEVLLLERAPPPPAGEVPASLETGRLTAAGLGMQPPPSLYAALISRQPPTPAECARVPAPCPGMAAVLPAVLRRSVAEAAALARCLPVGQRRRVSTAALCLQLWERRQGGQLPADILRPLLLAALE